MHDPATFFLKDPGTAENATEIPQMPPKMLIDPSLDTRHLGQIVKYTSFFTKFIHPPYELQDALDAQPYIAKGTIDAKTIKTRFNEVGGVVRDLFQTEKEYANRMKEIVTFINSSHFEKRLDQLISAVAGDHDSIIRAEPVKDRPVSSLFALTPDSSYEEGTVKWRSEYLRKLIIKRRWDTIWEKFAWRDSGTGLGTFFEQVAYHRLLNDPGGWKARTLSFAPFLALPRVSFQEAETSGDATWNSFLEKWEAGFKRPPSDGTVLLFKASAMNQPIVEFGDSLGRGFNCTLAASKRLNIDRLKELAGKFAVEAKKFQLFMLVPRDHYATFVLSNTSDVERIANLEVLVLSSSDAGAPPAPSAPMSVRAAHLFPRAIHWSSSSRTSLISPL